MSSDAYGIPWGEIGMEEWRPVVGAPGYEVSELGQVRNRSTRFVLKPRPNAGGYLQVTVDHRRGLPIHRAVAEAFLGSRPPGHQVDHRDGDRRNNRRWNLEWVTPKTNAQRAGIRTRERRHRAAAEKFPPRRSELELLMEENLMASGNTVVTDADVDGVRKRRSW